MILKSLVLAIFLVFINVNILNASVKGDLKKFKRELKKENYIDAMDIYSKNVNGMETEKFQNAIYNQIIKLIKKDDIKAKQLIQNYLDVEYDNPFGLYLLVKVYNIQKEYSKSIEILHRLRTQYLDEDFKVNVENTLSNTVDLYLENLKSKNNLDDIYYFIELSNQNNDELSINKSYVTLLKIHKDEVSKNNIIESLEVLYKIKTYYINEDLLIKINRYIDTVISDYLKKLLKDKNKVELERLENFLNINGDIENLQKLQEAIKKQNSHKYEIQLEKYGVHYLINVSSGGYSFKLLLDTGASTTAINNSMVQQLSYKVLKENIKLSTANGITYTKLISFDNFNIDTIELKNFKATILQQNMPYYDGLLGMNFFRNYKFFINQETNTLYLD